MRRIFITFFLFLIPIVVFTQVVSQIDNMRLSSFAYERPFRFGLTFGLILPVINIDNYSYLGENPDFINSNPYHDSEINSDSYLGGHTHLFSSAPGIKIGIQSCLRITRSTEIRFMPGISFWEQTIFFNYQIPDLAYDRMTNHEIIRSTSLDFPLNIRFNNKKILKGKPYFFLGGSYQRNLSDTHNMLSIKSDNIYTDLGTGISRNLPMVRFSLELKLSICMRDQLEPIPDEYVLPYFHQSIRSLKTNVLTLSVNFD